MSKDSVRNSNKKVGWRPKTAKLAPKSSCSFFQAPGQRLRWIRA